MSFNNYSEVLQIPKSLLKNPGNTDLVLGKGVFGVCKLKYYRGNPVAVKELMTTSNIQATKNAVSQEAQVLSKLKHPIFQYYYREMPVYSIRKT